MVTWVRLTIVSGSADTCTQSSESYRTGLGDDGVCDGSHGECVRERDDYTETCLGVVGSATLVDSCGDTKCHQAADVESSSVKVDGSTSKVGSQDESESIGNKPETRVDKTELERKVGRHTSL
jgi:hypothetical protein